MAVHHDDGDGHDGEPRDEADRRLDRAIAANPNSKIPALVDRSGPAGRCRDCPGGPGEVEEDGMAMSAELVRRLDAAWASLAAQRSRVEAGAPWPLSERFDTTPEAYWYPPEVLGHVALADLSSRFLADEIQAWDGAVPESCAECDCEFCEAPREETESDTP